MKNFQSATAPPRVSFAEPKTAPGTPAPLFLSDYHRVPLSSMEMFSDARCPASMDAAYL